MQRNLGLVSVLFLALAGCEVDDVSDAGHTHVSHEAGVEAGLEDDVVPCPNDTPTFEPGMSVQGESGEDGGVARITARLVSAQPTAPRKFENSWVLEFVDKAGKPIEDIKVTPKEPWMDVHGHGGGYPPDVVAVSQPGQLKFDRINLKMSGPWRLNLEASSAQAGEDEIVIHVCVP